MNSIPIVFLIILCQWGGECPSVDPPDSCGLLSDQGAVCCEWSKKVDRHCCDKGSYNEKCIDDCVPEERSGDSVLYSIDYYCAKIDDLCSWSYVGHRFQSSESSGCGEGS